MPVPDILHWQTVWYCMIDFSFINSLAAKTYDTFDRLDVFVCNGNPSRESLSISNTYINTWITVSLIDWLIFSIDKMCLCLSVCDTNLVEKTELPPHEVQIFLLHIDNSMTSFNNGASCRCKISDNTDFTTQNNDKWSYRIRRIKVIPALWIPSLNSNTNIRHHVV